MFEIDTDRQIISGRGYRLYAAVGEPTRRIRWLESGIHPLLTSQRGASPTARFEEACNFQQKAYEAKIRGVGPVYERRSVGLDWAYTTDAFETDLAELIRKRAKPLDAASIGSILLDLADTLVALKRRFHRTHGQLALNRLLLFTDDLRELAAAGDKAGPVIVEFDPDPKLELTGGQAGASLVPGEATDLRVFGELIIRLADGLPESRSREINVAFIPGEGAGEDKRWMQLGGQRAAWIGLARGLLTPPPFTDPPTIERLREHLLDLAPRLAVQRSQARNKQLEAVLPPTIPSPPGSGDQVGSHVTETDRGPGPRPEKPTPPDPVPPERPKPGPGIVEQFVNLPWGRITMGILGLVLLAGGGTLFWRWKYHPARVALAKAERAIKLQKWGEAFSDLQTAETLALKGSTLARLASNRLKELTNFPGFLPTTKADRVQIDGDQMLLRFFKVETTSAPPYRIWFRISEGNLNRPWQVSSGDGSASLQQAGNARDFAMAWIGESTQASIPLVFSITGLVPITNFVQIEVRPSPPPRLVLPRDGSIDDVVGKDVTVTAEVADDPHYFNQPAQVTWTVSGPGGGLTNGSGTNAHWQWGKVAGNYTNTWVLTDGAGRSISTDVIHKVTETEATRKVTARAEFTSLLEQARPEKALALLKTNPLLAEERRKLEASLTNAARLKAPASIEVIRGRRQTNDLFLDLPDGLGALRWVAATEVATQSNTRLAIATNLIISSNSFPVVVDATLETSIGAREFRLRLTNSLVSGSGLAIRVTVKEDDTLARYEQAVGLFQRHLYAESLVAFKNLKSDELKLAPANRDALAQYLARFEQRPQWQNPEPVARAATIGETIDLNRWQTSVVHRLERVTNWSILAVRPSGPPTNIVVVNWIGRSNLTVQVGSPFTPTNEFVVEVTGLTNQAMVQASGVLQLFQDSTHLVSKRDLEQLANIATIPTNSLPDQLAREVSQMLEQTPEVFKLGPPSSADGPARLEADPPREATLELRVANWPSSWKAKPDWKLVERPNDWPEGLRVNKTGTGLVYLPKPSETGSTNGVTLQAEVAGRQTEKLYLQVVTKPNLKPKIGVISAASATNQTYSLEFSAWDPDRPSERLRRVSYSLGGEPLIDLEPVAGSTTNFSKKIVLNRGTNDLNLVVCDSVWTNELRLPITFSPPVPLSGILKLNWVNMPEGTAADAGSWSGPKGFWVAANLLSQADLQAVRTRLDDSLIDKNMSAATSGGSQVVVITADADEKAPVPVLHRLAASYLARVQAKIAPQLGGWRLSLGSPAQHLAWQARYPSSSNTDQSRPDGCLLLTATPGATWGPGSEALTEFNLMQSSTELRYRAVFRIFVSPPAP